MRRLSSKLTFFWKRMFPVLWFGFLGFFLVAGLLGMLFRKEFEIGLLTIPIVMAGFGYFIMKLLVFDLVDEVLDDGDTLVIRNNHQEERIALTNIINVSFAQFTNPQRITLTLRDACIFGKEVTFSPLSRVLPLSTHPISLELIDRINEKRKKG